MREVKTILKSSWEALMPEFQELVQDGWVIDRNHPPGMWGIMHEVHLVKTDADAAQVTMPLQTLYDGKPKMTSAERMAKARASRGINKTEQQHIG